VRLRARTHTHTHCRHPLIRGLKDAVAEVDDAVEGTPAELGHLLFDAALLESGFVPENYKGFTSRVRVSASARVCLCSCVCCGSGVVCMQP